MPAVKPAVESSDALSVLAALAQPWRLETFRLLIRYLPYGLAAGDIARLIAIPHNTLSTHLQAMENAGVWERSIVLVSADHGFRDANELGYSKDDLHVPFLLKSPGGGVDDLDPQAPFETIQSADLLLKLMLQH